VLTKWTLAITVALAVLASSEAQAACTISTTNVAFGTYNVFNSSPTDSTGSITFKCGFFDFNILVALSQGASGSYFPRTLRRGSGPLPYNLYRDAARTSVWGNGSGGTSQYTNPWSFGQTITLTIYGRVDPGADVSAGTYADSIVATVNF